MPRLPANIRACLFDLDGVITDTARLHVKAWTATFDAYLAEQDGQAPFDPDADYDAHVDGKPREDGVRDFLKSRGIDADEDLVHRLAEDKNDRLLRLVEQDGVEVFDGSVAFVRAVREAGLRTAVVSSSANTRQVLESVGLTELFEERVDGVRIADEGLRGKPAPDSFLRGAELLDVAPADAAVFEDALAGVEAGRAGSFGLTVGVHRHGDADALRQHGADVVVDDLSELL